MELPHAQHHAVSWDATTPTKSPGRRVRSCQNRGKLSVSRFPRCSPRGHGARSATGPRRRSAAGFAETPHVDELVADRAVALHDPSVRLPIGTVADGAGWQALTRSPKVNLVSTVAGTFPLPSNRTECRQLRVERRMRQ